MVHDQLLASLHGSPAVRSLVPELERQVRDGELTATLAAEHILRLLVILDGEQLDEDGLVTPAIWYTHRGFDLPLAPPHSELARFAAEVLGQQAKVYDAVDDGMGRVYVDL